MYLYAKKLVGVAESLIYFFIFYIHSSRDLVVSLLDSSPKRPMCVDVSVRIKKKILLTAQWHKKVENRVLIIPDDLVILINRPEGNVLYIPK